MPFRVHTKAVQYVGSGTVIAQTSSLIVGGLLYGVIVSSQYAAGADIEIVTSRARIPVLSLTDVAPGTYRYFPMAAGHDASAAPIEWADGIPLRVPIPLGNEYIEIRVTDGGASNFGVFRFVIIHNNSGDF